MELDAFDVGVSSESTSATAFDTMIPREAVGIVSAGVFLAWIDADAVQPVAQLLRWAIFIVLTD